MTARTLVHVEPDAGIPDLVRRLTDDSRRLVRDEFTLAKMEAKENVRLGARGAMWLGISFGLAVIALTALTIFVATVIGRLLGENYWAGALITGVLELAIAGLLLKAGLARLKEPPYTLPETRREAAATARWVANSRTS